MGDLSVKLKKSKRDAHKDESDLAPDEQRALAKMQREAKAAGATLATGGEGGLPPSMVLGAMRRDGFKCKRCGGQSNLSVHHKAHLDNPSPKMKRLGESVDQRNDPKAIVTICENCHDGVHDEDRANVEGNAPGGCK